MKGRPAFLVSPKGEFNYIQPQISLHKHSIFIDLCLFHAGNIFKSVFDKSWDLETPYTT